MGEISRLLTTLLLNALWQITAIAALAILCSRLLRRMPSRYGYAMWVLALAGCWLVPVTTVVIQASVAPGIRAVDAASKTDSAATERAPQTKAGLSVSFHALSRSLSVSPVVMRGLLWTYAALLLFQIARLAWAFYRTSQFRKCSYPRPMSPTLCEIAETSMRAFLTSADSRTLFTPNALDPQPLASFGRCSFCRRLSSRAASRTKTFSRRSCMKWRTSAGVISSSTYCSNLGVYRSGFTRVLR